MINIVSKLKEKYTNLKYRNSVNDEIWRKKKKNVVLSWVFESESVRHIMIKIPCDNGSKTARVPWECNNFTSNDRMSGDNITVLPVKINDCAE